MDEPQVTLKQYTDVLYDALQAQLDRRIQHIDTRLALMNEWRAQLASERANYTQQVEFDAAFAEWTTWRRTVDDRLIAQESAVRLTHASAEDAARRTTRNVGIATVLLGIIVIIVNVITSGVV